MARKTSKTAKTARKAVETPATPRIVTRLLPFKVEDDTLIRAHVRGVMVSQEIFQVNELNRMLIALTQHRQPEKVRFLLDHLLTDATLRVPVVFNELLRPGQAALHFDEATRRAFRQCVEANNPIAALSLLRLARVELMMAHAITRAAPLQAAEVRRIVEQCARDNLHVSLPLTALTGKMFRVFGSTAWQLRRVVHEAGWCFGEFLNAPYALQTGLLYPAQLMFAKCYALKMLSELLCAEHISDFNTLEQNNGALKTERYDYLMRQTQMVMVALSGIPGRQFGLEPSEARAVLDSMFHQPVKQVA